MSRDKDVENSASTSNYPSSSSSGSGDGVLKSNFITDRPVAITVIFLATVVFGYFSLANLPIALMPELAYPTITVRTAYPGAAPEEVENDVSRPLEESLGVISGLKKISSISRAGVSDVVLQFRWGMDVSDATQLALERLDRVRLPKEAERPLLLRFDPSLDPVLELSFSGMGEKYEGPEGLRRLRRIADLQIKRFLEPVDGVAAVRVRGGLEEEIHVLVNEPALARSKLTMQQLITRLRQENINLAGGLVSEGGADYTVRTLNEFANLDQIRDTIIRYDDDTPLRVKDVAEVSFAFKEREIITTTDGSESVQIDIYKEADANMVELAKNIRSLVGEIPKPRAGGRKGGNRAEGGGGNARKGKGGRRGARVPGVGRAFSGGKGGGRMKLAAHLFNNENAKLSIVADRSIFIKEALDEVKQSAFLGGLLAIFVLYLFLRNVKSTAIIAVSIPISILVTFAPMHLSGVSLNIMSLGGLALGIGMLVDSSIVVLESIYRCREEGDDLRAAAIRGVGEVRGAVFASVLTSIAVFFPMIFVEGIAGQAFGDLGVTVVISLLVSYLVAVALIPMLAARRPLKSEESSQQLDEPPKRAKAVDIKTVYANTRATIKKTPLWQKLLILPIAYLGLRLTAYFVLYLLFTLLHYLLIALAAIGRFGVLIPLKALLKILMSLPLRLVAWSMDGLRSLYRKCITWLLGHLSVGVLMFLICLAGTGYLLSRLQAELLPEVYQGEFTLEVNLPIGTPVEETQRILNRVENALLESEEGAFKTDVKNLLVTYGYDVTQTQNAREGEHTAKFKFIVKKGGNNQAREKRVLDEVRKLFTDIPDLEMRVIRPVLFSEQTPVEVEVSGRDLEQLRTKTLAVRNLLSKLPELADVETSFRRGAPEIQIVYDRDKIIKYGLNISTVAESVRDRVQGFEATRFNKIDRRIPIMVRLQKSDREAIESVRNLVVNPGKPRPIPLYAVADLKIGEGPSEVRRINGTRTGLISANLGEATLSEATATINHLLRTELDWSDGTFFNVTGQSEEWDQSKGSLFIALALSIFLVFVIMAAQFESLLHPLVIMFSIPLAFLGSFAGALLTNTPLSIVVVLGLVMLTGMVVNNAIVLVDYVNQLRARGMELNRAVVEAGCIRLRPIIMTSATTVLGLAPLALGLGEGAEIRKPMAMAVVFGLMTSTFLTLLIIPSIYAGVERLKIKVLTRVAPNYREGADADSADSARTAESSQ